MRCLILGASGFLGRHVYTALCADPRLEVHTAGRRAAHADLWLDLTRAGAAAVAEVLRVAAPAVVVNCVGAVAGDPAGLAAGNVVSVAALLDGIGRLPYPPRLVHVGCAAEYRPVDAYATTKLAGTELLLAARRQGVPAVVLRVFDLLGPGSPAGSVAGRLAAAVAMAARTGEPARVGRLAGYRDFVDVRDVAAAVLAAATAPELPPPLLNVGSGRATAVRTLAAALVARSGGPGVLESGAAPAETATTWQRADLTATMAALGWRPTVDLGASVRDMLPQAVPV